MRKYLSLNKRKKGIWNVLNMKGGCYNILDYNKFLDLYCSEIKKGRKWSLVEKQMNPGYLFLDFDVSFNLNDVLIGEKGVYYDYLNEIKEVADLIQTALKQIIIDGNYEYIVTQKDKGSFKNMFISYGFHLHYPYIVIPIWLKLFIKEKLNKQIKEILFKTKMIQEEMIDEGILRGSSGIMLYGSSKPKNDVYKCIYQSGKLKIDTELIKLLSVYNKKKESILKKEILKLKPEEKKRKILEEKVIKKIDKKIFSKLLNLLTEDYYNDYTKWIKIGFILRNEKVDSELLDSWSQKSVKYNEYKVKKHWDNLKEDVNGLKIGSLFKYVKDCNLNGYNKLISSKDYKKYNKDKEENEIVYSCINEVKEHYPDQEFTINKIETKSNMTLVNLDDKYCSICCVEHEK